MVYSEKAGITDWIKMLVHYFQAAIATSTNELIPQIGGNLGY